MKVKINLSLKNGKTVEVLGTKHNLKLDTGEIIKVVIHRPYLEKDEPPYWCVSDFETGIQIVGFVESHTFFTFTDFFCDVTTRKNALLTCKERLNWHLKNKGINYKKFKEDRLKKLKVHKEEQV